MIDLYESSVPILFGFLINIEWRQIVYGFLINICVAWTVYGFLINIRVAPKGLLNSQNPLTKFILFWM